MDDPVAVRVVGQPAFAVADQLVDLVDPDEIMLRAVDHRAEDEEVPQQVADRLEPSERDRGDARAAPLGEPVVERMPAQVDLVTERLERLANDPLAPRTVDA